jgi:hypothetical protein
MVECVGAMSTATSSVRAVESAVSLLPERPADGDVRVRNRGTFGLVRADPAADWPAAIRR